MKKWVSVLLALCVVSAFGQAWFIETVDTTGNVGAFTSLAIDTENKPHIAYMKNDSFYLKYATWNGSIWETETVDDNSGLMGVGLFASLALGPVTERPQIAYYDGLNGHLKWANLNAAGDWIVGIPDNGGGVSDVGQGCDMVVSDESGEEIPHFAYYDATAGLLMYARPLGSVWSRDTVDSVGPLPIFGSDIKGTSITLDANGSPHIAYYAWDADSALGFLKHAYLVSGDWVIDTVERTNPGDVGQWPEIRIGEESENRPYISYFDNINGHFKYARKVTDWAIDIIDNTPGVGMFGAQILGSTYASYYDGPNGNLKYAYSDNYLGWHTEEVDTGGDVGQYTSIALSKKGEVNFPHISYYDVTNGDLKYATKIIKDVKPVLIAVDASDPDEIEYDQPYNPWALLRNQGNTVSTFDVSFIIRFSSLIAYSHDTTIGPLSADEETEVIFKTWEPPRTMKAWYYMECYTSMPDDSVPSNDTIYDSIWCRDTITGVKETQLLPASYELNVRTGQVMLSLPAMTEGELYVMDVTGSRRMTLYDGNFLAGTYVFNIDRSELPSGVYFIKFSSQDANLTQKTVLVN